MERILEFLKSCRPYYLATVEDGQPRVRPFGTIDLFEGRLYIQTARAKAVSAQMKAEPRIEICGTSGGKWMRVTAEAELDSRTEPQRHMLDAYPHLKGKYQPDDGNNEVFFLKNGTATIESFTDEPVVIRF